MGTIAAVRVPTDQFALAETFAAVPDVSFEIERVVAHGGERVIPFVWAVGDEARLSGLDDALRADPSVDAIEPVAELEGERLYAMEWDERTRATLRAIVGDEGTILSARGTTDGWRLRILFADHESLSATFRSCKDRGIDLDAEGIYRLERGAERGRYGLTKEQYETLVAGVERGFFDVPRGVSAEELAEDLGISHQALSERLRRAQKQLAERTLDVEGDEAGGDADGRTDPA
ncbi:helix-turn-helix domain-containing protein [Halegenticoccus tardaugens]|uniref:helix-turn-helix domain-containing protein n=1 Tax=Halegenticoccus tardaugens TaxID=2071624 RepID=UPI00100A8C48|nr:helix-turn-helix domain-containing protein [Halegenticoccus tardaugens]